MLFNKATYYFTEDYVKAKNTFEMSEHSGFCASLDSNEY